MIPVSKPIFAKNAKKYLLECINSGWVSSSGPYVGGFEQKFAQYLGMKYAITATSGTAALHLALTSLEIGKGDEVIVPSFTMIAPVFAILYTGAKPVLADSGLQTWNIDVSQIEKKITKKTKAIIAVHTYGHPVNMDPLIAIAKKHGLFIIEDAAEALGAEYKNKKTGTLGDISCFSFYANKTITTGEGGMVVTNNKSLHKRLLLLKDMAHSRKKRFLHSEIGFTYRMTNMQAALGLAQLEQIEKFVKQKRFIAKFYNQYLSKISYLTLPLEKPWAKSIYWMYGILVNRKSPISKDTLTKKLFDKGIDTRDFFIPMHHQPALKKLGLFKKEHYPVADHLSKLGFYLPSGPDISQKQLTLICKTIKEMYEL